MWWKQNKIKKEKIILILVLALSFFLRVYKISQIPAGFSLDEMSQGYTAYSILKTGKDEWGEFLPLAPRAFGDYRSPLYTYLCIPFIALLGLTETALRLPNVILGTLSVAIIYFLGKTLLKEKILAEDQKIFPILAAFLLAVSPWHISLSRGAFEANLNTFFYPFALWLFLVGLRKEKWLAWSGLVFGLNIFTYYSPRFFTPISVLILILFFRKSLLKNRFFLKFLIIFFAFCLLAVWTLMIGGKTRVADTSIFNPTDHWQNLSSRQYEAVFEGFSRLAERFFNNKATFVVNQFVKNLLTYHSFEFLFTKGASEATYGMIPGRGVLYLFELPLLLIGLWQIVKRKDKNWWLILGLLVFSFFPAALAKGERAANRAVTGLLFLIILSAYGATWLVSWTKERRVKLSYGLIVLIFFSFFLEDYFYHSQKYSAPSMAYGWAEAMSFVGQVEDNYEQVIISRQFSEPQIGVAFYKKWAPRDFQEKSQDWLVYQEKGFLFVDQLPEYSLGKYHFRNFDFPEDSRLEKTLLIGKDEDFWGINEGRVLKKVYFPGPEQKVAFKIVDFEQEDLNND